MAKRVCQFDVSGSGSGGAGWIGRAPELGRQGEYFATKRPYTTDDPFMIEALMKSGVAELTAEWEVEDGEEINENTMSPVDIPDPENPTSLGALTVPTLKNYAKSLAITGTKNMNKTAVIEAIKFSTRGKPLVEILAEAQAANAE